MTFCVRHRIEILLLTYLMHHISRRNYRTIDTEQRDLPALFLSLSLSLSLSVCLYVCLCVSMCVLVHDADIEGVKA